MTGSIEIEVRAYGHLSQFMPGRRERMTTRLPVGTTVQDLLSALAIADQDVWIVVVSGARVPPQSVLRDGDRVEILPPLGGGQSHSVSPARSSRSNP